MAVWEVFNVSVKPSDLCGLCSWEFRVTAPREGKAEVVGFTSYSLLLGKVLKHFWTPLPNTDVSPWQKGKHSLCMSGKERSQMQKSLIPCFLTVGIRLLDKLKIPLTPLTLLEMKRAAVFP